MDTTFNFNRFLKVLSNEWSLTWKKIAMFWALMFGIISAIFLGIFVIGALGEQHYLINRGLTARFSAFFLCLLQGLYLQFYFREFSSKKKTQALFLLPASQNETFWAKFTPGAVLSLLMSIVFITIVVFISGAFNEWVWNNGLSELRAEEDFVRLQDLTFFVKDILAIFSLWLLVASGLLFGLFLFKKNAILKSFLFWIVVLVALWSLASLLFLLFTGSFFFFIDLGTVWIGSNEIISFYTRYPILLPILHGFIGLALIAISRVKFNEKTI